MAFWKVFQPRQAVPQTQPLPGQVPNDAGGHWYAVDDWAKLDRFLVLGTEAGTYHVSERQLTLDNAAAVLRCIDADGVRVVNRVVEISQAGRAPKNDPALFVLAMASASSEPVRKAALAALPLVARTGTHVLTFAKYVEGFRGWGRGLRRAVAGWFTQAEPERLALQAVKYRQRDGWALRDLLRLAHPLTDRAETRVLFDWIAHPEKETAIQAARAAFPLIDGMYWARAATTPAEVAAVVRAFKLPREAVPTEVQTAAEVWAALLPDMPATALLRSLGRMGAAGLLTRHSQAAAEVVGRLRNAPALARARVHPIAILLALRTYAQGRGELGKLTWTPVPEVIEALDGAFERAFATVEPTGRRVLVAVDVSGSMRGTRCAGSPVLTAHHAAAAMAMLFLRREKQAAVIAFDTQVHEPGLSPNQRLDDVVARLSQWGGGTDVALPMQYALQRRLMVDAFVLITDSETWAGRQHPIQALAEYRRQINPRAKAVVLAVAANGGSVVPDDDALSLGVAGFDAAVPQVVADFLRS